MRSIRPCSVNASRSVGCQPASAPLRLPIGVRTVSTITASRISIRVSVGTDTVGYRCGMDRGDLELVVAIGRTGSLTAAARQLHIAQPPLSRRLQAHRIRDRRAAVHARASRRDADGRRTHLGRPGRDRAGRDPASRTGRGGRRQRARRTTQHRRDADARRGAASRPRSPRSARSHRDVRLDLVASGDSAALRQQVRDGATRRRARGARPAARTGHPHRAHRPAAVRPHRAAGPATRPIGQGDQSEPCRARRAPGGRAHEGFGTAPAARRGVRRARRLAGDRHRDVRARDARAVRRRRARRVARAGRIRDRPGAGLLDLRARPAGAPSGGRRRRQRPAARARHRPARHPPPRPPTSADPAKTTNVGAIAG